MELTGIDILRKIKHIFVAKDLKFKQIIASKFYKKLKIENKVIIDNFLGNGYGGDPKYIIDELIKLDPKTKIVLLSRHPNGERVPNGVKVVKYRSLRSLREFYTAKIWISNVRNTYKPRRREGQYYLQIWHGTHPAKLIEAQAEDNLSKGYIECAKIDGCDITHFLVDCLSQEQIYKKYFWLNDEVKFLRYGLLRNDYLLKNANAEHKDKIRNNLQIDSKAFVVLYAPTFRDDQDKTGYILDVEKFVDQLNKKYNNVVLLTRFHPNDKNLAKMYKYSNNIINATDYPNGQDLVIACDIMITDYSSIAFDAAIINKPVFVLEKDILSYKKSRGFSDAYNDWPFVKVKDDDELINAITNFNINDYYKNLKKYYMKDTLYDTGNTAEKVCNWILSSL